MFYSSYQPHQYIENIEKFIGLKTVILDNILDDPLNPLTSLPNLSSLIINQDNSMSRGQILYYSIIYLPELKYCKESCDRYEMFYTTLNVSNGFSPIEHLIIKNRSNLERLHELLLCVSHLRRLSINYLFCYDSPIVKAFPKVSDKLTHVSLKVKYIKFRQFEPFIINIFYHLRAFRISTNVDIEYLNANRWERVIYSFMVHLRIFAITLNFWFIHPITTICQHRVFYIIGNRFHRVILFVQKLIRVKNLQSVFVSSNSNFNVLIFKRFVQKLKNIMFI